MADMKWTPSQRQAIEADGRNICVSAAAGSGKTTVLTNRITERICSPAIRADISRMLVVTYTHAAADELKSRLGKAIDSAREKAPFDRHLARQALLLPCAKISTVHSFCLDLIRANFRELDIPSDIHVADETVVARIRTEICEELISDYYDGKIAGEYAMEDFRRFVNTFGNPENADVLIKTVCTFYDKLGETPDGTDTLDFYAAECENARDADFFSSKWGAEIKKYLASAMEYYEKTDTAALEYIGKNPDYEKYAAAFEDDLFLIRSLRAENINYDQAACLLGSYSPTKFGSLKKGTVKTQEILFFVECRNDFKAEVKKLADGYFCFTRKAVSEAFDFTARAARDLKKFLTLFDRRFSEEKKQKKILTYADMERFALKLLWDRENDDKTDIARAVCERTDEIYVDEYQDTNPVQHKIFSLISRGDNLFAVGDMKQSIYGFRGSYPEIFKSMTDNAVKYGTDTAKTPAKVFLSENFRSYAEILGYTNSVFEKLMNVEGACGYGEDEKLVCGKKKGNKKVEIHIVEKKTKADDEISSEADFVARKINSLIGTKKADGSPLTAGDVAILLRDAKNKSAAYERALKKYGIPCESTKTDSFFENPEILLAYSLLNTVDNPSRDAYLAATLKSPLYGFTLDELIYVRRKTKSGTLFEALKAFVADTEFEKGERFLSDNRKYRALAAALPIDKLIWQIYGETGLFCIPYTGEGGTVHAETARANLLQLYRWSSDFAKGSGGLHEFLQFVNDAMESGKKVKETGAAERTDCVKIVTVHSGKGLEYPVCFLCDCNKAIEDKNAADNILFDHKLGIAPKIPSGNGFYIFDTPLCAALRMKRKSDIVFEETRLLYVAMTRAKERLFITAQAEPRKDASTEDIYNPAKYIMKSGFYSFYLLYNSGGYLDMVLSACPVSPDMELSFSHGDEAEEKYETAARESTDDISESKIEEILKRLDFRYKYADMTKIPSKLSVSKLYPAVLDDDGMYANLDDEEKTETKMPRFMMESESDDMTAAERGIAIHTFMQFADFENVMKNGIEAERERLIEKGFLFAASREKLDMKKLAAFFAGDTAKMIMNAKKVYREKRFLINYPAELFTRDKEKAELYSGQEVLVQGVIDCVLFDENGEIILIDYKTDSFSKGTSPEYIRKTLCERHRLQLGYYKYACERMFGKNVAHVLIYSFSLSEAVEIYDL